MKRVKSIIALYLSLWHSLLGIACIILIYLTGIHISEAITISSLFAFFNTEHAFLTWEPSCGMVDHYLLEITDTQLIGGGKHTAQNRITTTRYETSPEPGYRLDCFHNHSYQVRIKAISPAGVSSDYSEPSILFICDQESPKLSLASLPFSSKKVRSQNITLTGSFDEAHIDTLTLNDTAASIDYQRNTFSAVLTLTPGDNTIELEARDLAGNISTDTAVITYAPITMLSVPGNARIYWNGNYAYPGSYGGTTPRAYNLAGQQKQTLRLSFPGFQDFIGAIDFSDLSRDSYVISLIPHVPSLFTRLETVIPDGEHAPPFSNPHPFVVDFNSDGRKDLLVGNADGTISIYLNQGSNDLPLFSDHMQLNTDDGTIIDVGTNAAPFMVDYDNNGAFDLLVGAGDGYLYCFSNRGSTSAPAYCPPYRISGVDGTPITVEGNCVPWVTDWNGDNRKDLLLGGGSGTLTLTLNVGSDSAPLFSPLRSVRSGGKPFEADGPIVPCVFDWNADGRHDILVGTGDGYVTIYDASDGNNEPEISEGIAIQLNGQPLVIEGTPAAFPVDWNQDGTNELLLGSSDGTIYLLR